MDLKRLIQDSNHGAWLTLRDRTYAVRMELLKSKRKISENSTQIYGSRLILMLFRYMSYVHLEGNEMIFPMTYSMAEAYVRPNFKPYRSREFDLLCTLR